MYSLLRDSLLEKHLLLIEDMLTTICGRNTNISFSETKEFQHRVDQLIQESTLPSAVGGFPPRPKSKDVDN